jgi:hypothetical protein
MTRIADRAMFSRITLLGIVVPYVTPSWNSFQAGSFKSIMIMKVNVHSTRMWCGQTDRSQEIKKSGVFVES